MDVYSLEAQMHTGPIPVVVTAQMTLNLVIGSDLGVPVPANFSYSAHEPLAVTAEFNGGGVSVEWVFARELLDAGMQGPVGDGDVMCWPTTVDDQPVVCIALHSPSGQALLEAPAEEIDTFLRRSYDAVPAGRESDHLDIDGLIDDLLAG